MMMALMERDIATEMVLVADVSMSPNGEMQQVVHIEVFGFILKRVRFSILFGW
jgi:hypothetical protein